MYLSCLKLNNYSNRAMTEIERPYELHRTIMQGFPDKEAGGPGRVLFRLDIDNQGKRITVLVQSEKEPDWRYLDGSNLLKESAEYKVLNILFKKGQVWYFRLRANPTVKKKDNKRLGIIGEDKQRAWLKRKGEAGGFELGPVVAIPENITRDSMTDVNKQRHKISLLSVRFEGILKITNPDIFKETLKDGVGSAKGLGFGLLSIAPVQKE